MSVTNMAAAAPGGLPGTLVAKSGTYYSTADTTNTIAVDNTKSGPRNVRIYASGANCYIAEGTVVFSAESGNDAAFNWEIIPAGTFREFVLRRDTTYSLRVTSGAAAYLYELV